MKYEKKYNFPFDVQVKKKKKPKTLYTWHGAQVCGVWDYLFYSDVKSNKMILIQLKLWEC